MKNLKLGSGHKLKGDLKKRMLHRQIKCSLYRLFNNFGLRFKTIILSYYQNSLQNKQCILPISSPLLNTREEGKK